MNFDTKVAGRTIGSFGPVHLLKFIPFLQISAPGLAILSPVIFPGLAAFRSSKMALSTSLATTFSPAAWRSPAAHSARRENADGHVAVDADIRIAPQTVVGFAVSGGQADSTLANNLGMAKTDVYQAGLYGMTRFGALSPGLAGSYASLQVDTNRSIPALGAGPLWQYHRLAGGCCAGLERQDIRL
jgi:Autotransporter beta-domain